MELNQTQRKKGLLEKIPDIEKTLKVVDFLNDRKIKVSSSRSFPPPPSSVFPFSHASPVTGTFLTYLIRFFVQADKKLAGEPSSDDEDDLDDEAVGESSSKPIKSLFELNDTLYAEAEIQETGDVYLWLGVSLPIFLCFHFPSACLLSCSQRLASLTPPSSPRYAPFSLTLAGQRHALLPAPRSLGPSR